MSFDFAVMLSKSFGLFWLIGMAIGAVAYAYWPSNRKRFHHAASIALREEDRP
ncbi:MAG: cbb3-type cytochrome c oxidase subunit 3 [Paucibacter sp.]|nr:cbb3-type cytochrome c oxidase subunit 3 [Roseateles sp.]